MFSMDIVTDRRYVKRSLGWLSQREIRRNREQPFLSEAVELYRCSLGEMGLGAVLSTFWTSLDILMST